MQCLLVFHVKCISNIENCKITNVVIKKQIHVTNFTMKVALGASYLKGKLNQNILPYPTVLSTPISPLCPLNNFWTGKESKSQAAIFDSRVLQLIVSIK